MNPLDWTGPEFLRVYIPYGLIIVAFAWLVKTLYLSRHRDELGVVEFMPEEVAGDAGLRDLALIRQAVPVLLHGIGLSLGSAEGARPREGPARGPDRARRSLESKRRRAAAHLLPRLRTALEDAWKTHFHEHATAYNPTGMLHHVDDAWGLAETLQRHPDLPVARAAHDDLVMLKLRYQRDPRAEAERIQERRGLLVAVVHTPVRRIVVRWPGRRVRVWSWRL